MASANKELTDAIIRHAHAVERFKAGEIARILGMLNREVYPAVLKELQARLARITAQGQDYGLESTQRLRDLAKALDGIIREGYDRVEDRLVADIHGFSKLEATVAARQLTKAAGIALDLTLPAPGLLRVLATEKPFAGSTLADHWDALTRASQRNVRRALNVGMVSGETFEQITARIQGTRGLKLRDGALELSRRQVRSLVGSAVQHAGHSARQATYRENADVLKGEKWVATLDSRTCPQCQALDGEEFPLGEGPQPPVHLGPCRCVRVPVLKSWESMGFDVGDLPESTRASLNGEVPEKTTYPEWLAGQSESVQDDALGPERAALFRTGKVTIDRFVDDTGRTLTLEELYSLEGLDT